MGEFMALTGDIWQVRLGVDPRPEGGGVACERFGGRADLVEVLFQVLRAHLTLNRALRLFHARHLLEGK